MMMTLLKIIIQRARKRERVGNGKDENGRIYFKKKTKEKIPIVITKKKIVNYVRLLSSSCL